MTENDRCPRCGALVLPEENYCPKCGAALRGEAARTVEPEALREREIEAPDSGWRPGEDPCTIEGLQAFCEYHHMPLEKMRFFVGVNYRQPRAFGIYRDGDNFVVYKNKEDGSRAVRYHGPDEAHAVGELYAKLLDECHKRDIWPGGKPEAVVRKQKRNRTGVILLALSVVLVFGVLSFLIVRSESKNHAHDGYYRFDDDGIYYRYGSTWYYDDDYYGWIEYHDIGYEDEYADYYVGDTYDDDWGYSDFRSSDTWDDLQEESRTSSSDYDSWDSGGTDWSSDW